MGMIAFFAGLVIGVLVGFFLLSLFAFFLAEDGGGVLPTQADGTPKSALEP
ncbi:MAG: hypothetical protein M0P73_05775 [Syntrophobacterales bacterium]|jgi:hypothetical protein|nr:hypothetical protein [Syntrophobacterales bacterium]